MPLYLLFIINILTFSVLTLQRSFTAHVTAHRPPVTSNASLHFISITFHLNPIVLLRQ